MEKETFLTFRLGQDLFAVEVSNVLEVLEKQTITLVPRAPKHILGIVNFRGNIVPVISTHQKFNLPCTNGDLNAILIVFETQLGGNHQFFAATADKVQDVIEVSTGEIIPIPEMGLSYDSKFIRGAIRRNESFILLLETENVFAQTELEVIN
jgi:purine-binding chemotaxis protein CheW